MNEVSMSKDQILNMHLQMNLASGKNVPPPTEDQIAIMQSLDAEMMAKYESGEIFYASDVCAGCGNYSGYGNVYCGNC